MFLTANKKYDFQMLNQNQEQITVELIFLIATIMHLFRCNSKNNTVQMMAIFFLLAANEVMISDAQARSETSAQKDSISSDGKKKLTSNTWIF